MPPGRRPPVGADSVRTRIQIGAGELTVRSGAAALLNATFTFGDPAWRPLVDYRRNDSAGELTIRQPRAVPNLNGGRENAWILELNPDVPMALDAELGGGTAELYLGDLNLTDLRARMGAGTALVDLTGDRKRDLNASLRGGVGTLTVRIPRDTGTRVTAEGILGTVSAPGLNVNGSTYTNDAYGQTPATLNITVQSGVGTITLEVGA
ncbi:MAG: toast rack family protein [Methanomicrobiales archaeon]|nr:toast rack family protein [Methanomicrobiales archaeon]